jgi:hypothetical protein
MTRLAATVLALLTLLTGCGLGERFQSAEDRINRLVPPTLALRNASEQLAATPEPQAGANAALEAQRKTRLKLRALSCARDVTPSWLTSDDDLRSRLSDKACFAAADQEMARWLNLVRVGRLLAQGPLRPIPAQPAALLASNDFVYTAAFAEQAGVALLGSSNKLVRSPCRPTAACSAAWPTRSTRSVPSMAARSWSSSRRARTLPGWTRATSSPSTARRTKPKCSSWLPGAGRRSPA